MAGHNNYRRGWKNYSVTEIDRVYFKFSDPVYKYLNSFIERGVLGQIKCKPEKRRRTVQGLKLFRLQVPVEVFYIRVLYRPKVHPAPLARSAYREFLSVPLQ